MHYPKVKKEKGKRPPKTAAKTDNKIKSHLKITMKNPEKAKNIDTDRQAKRRKQRKNMLLPLTPFFIAMPSTSPNKPNKKLVPNPNANSNSFLLCKHSPSATLDVLILILVLFSGTFLITSYFSYIFQSLSLILPSVFLFLADSFRESPLPCIVWFVVFFAASVVGVEICCAYRSRRCENPGCKGLKKAMEFDIQLQTEECLRSASSEIDGLPWKGGAEGNPDYECLRSELRRMAPPNGRAVLIFMARCGCPVSKLEAWGPKKGRRHKKGLRNLAIDGGVR